MQILLSLLNIIDLACKPKKIAAAITNKTCLNCDQVVENFMLKKHLFLSMSVVVLFSFLFLFIKNAVLITAA